MFYVSVAGTGASMVALLVRPLFSKYSMPRRKKLKKKDAPLLFGLTGAQLASVIAHEFGHFTQRREMLRSHRVNRVSR